MNGGELFALPSPRELGDGWTMKALTAAQMLESRGEGEALAAEERDKALWAGAVLLSHVLLREGAPAFESGRAVLEALTVGQIDCLTRLWWDEDSFCMPARRVWTAAEDGENVHFDMERFVALGGEAPEEGMRRAWPVRASQRGEALGQGGPDVLTVGPEEVFRVSGRALPMFDISREPRFTPDAGGTSGPAKAEAEAYAGRGLASADDGQARPAERKAAVLTLEELDRAVERDARRYDGGSPFY